MSIDKRGERTWRFRVKHKRQLYTMTYEAPPELKGKALEKEVERQHMIFKADVIAERVNLVKNITLNQLIEAVYKEYVCVALKYSSQKLYETTYNKYLIPEFGTMDLKDIKALHIQKFVNKLSTRLSPSSVEGILSRLSLTMRMGVKWGYLESSPCQYVQKPHKVSNNKELISLENIENLVDYYMNKEKSLLHKAGFALAIGCGLRNSEIRALTLDDIDFKDGIINIDKQIGLTRKKDGTIVTGYISPKTASSVRKIYAPQFVLEILKEYISKLPYIPTSKQIFISSRTQGPITSHCFSKHFTSVINTLGIPTIRFHDLRHLQATILIQSGVNVKAVSKRLGHSKVDITLNTYTSTIDAVDKKVAEQFDQTFKNLKSLS